LEGGDSLRRRDLGYRILMVQHSFFDPLVLTDTRCLSSVGRSQARIIEFPFLRPITVPETQSLHFIPCLPFPIHSFATVQNKRLYHPLIPLTLHPFSTIPPQHHKMPQPKLTKPLPDESEHPNWHKYDIALRLSTLKSNAKNGLLSDDDRLGIFKNT
jgi:hypothetical protein